jgi:endoglucanase
MNFLKAVGREIYEGDQPILLRGFGLGGWFLPEGYMWKLYTKCDRPRRMEAMIEGLCGKEYAKDFWKRYLDSYITEKDLEFIAKEGFNSVRLPLNARHLYERREQELLLNEKMFERIDRLLEWGRKYGLYVILDMHGAPGGQTGQNIDDSETDLPFLFMEEHYEEELIFLWKEIAKRYQGETAVAGYDLLNEPVPNFFRQYNNHVLPLYRRLIQAIREIDQKHAILLEGVHWATDFSIFDSFTKQEAADNIILQFHKYWSNPDAESLKEFMEYSERLQVPLIMGEGGENNCDWYTTVFPLYERLNISWSFWSYKKMACTNSPVTFDVPKDWDRLIHWIDSRTGLSPEIAVTIFDDFLLQLQSSHINQEVLNALLRRVPVAIPCEAYDDYQIRSSRSQGVILRMSDPVSLIFEDGKTGEVDYRRYGGEPQPESEKVLVILREGDKVKYQFHTDCSEVQISLLAEGDGELLLTLGSEVVKLPVLTKGEYSAALAVPGMDKQELWVSCEKGSIRLDKVYLNPSENLY